jgi:uncharacterized protein (TIGR00730 family)
MVSQGYSVCLFCGSRTGANPLFVAEARRLGRELAERGHRLVYGAGDRGLMGEAARAMQETGGRILGVIPQHLVDWEVGKSDIDEYFVTETMHERKKLMFDRSDAVIAMPGGTGTLDELIEVLTWRQLGLHAKPIVLVNLVGYWDPLIALIEHTIMHGFAEARFKAFLTVVPDAEAAIATVEELLMAGQLQRVG